MISTKNNPFSVNVDGLPYWNKDKIIDATSKLKEGEIIIGYAQEYFSLLSWSKAKYEPKKDSVYLYNATNYNNGFVINNKKAYLFPKSNILRLQYRDISLEDEDHLIHFLRRSFKFSDELQLIGGKSEILFPLSNNFRCTSEITMFSTKEILKKREACIGYLVDRNWKKYWINKHWWLEMEIEDIFTIVSKYFIKLLFG